MLIPMLLAATLATPLAGDFDGDGRADTAWIETGPDGRQAVLVTFATGVTARTSWAQGGATDPRIVPAATTARFCADERNAGACPPGLSSRDALAFTAADGGLTALGLWTGRELLLVVGITNDRGRPFLPTGDLPMPIHRGGSVLNASVVLRLAVGVTGAVTACDIAESSGSAALDGSACATMRREGRFRPTRDAGGAPIASTQRLRVSWRGDGTVTISAR